MVICRHCGSVLPVSDSPEHPVAVCSWCGAIYECRVEEIRAPRRTGRLVQPSCYVPIGQKGAA